MDFSVPRPYWASSHNTAAVVEAALLSLLSLNCPHLKDAFPGGIGSLIPLHFRGWSLSRFVVEKVARCVTLERSFSALPARMYKVKRCHCSFNPDMKVCVISFKCPWEATFYSHMAAQTWSSHIFSPRRFVLLRYYSKITFVCTGWCYRGSFWSRREQFVGDYCGCYSAGLKEKIAVDMYLFLMAVAAEWTNALTSRYITLPENTFWPE